MYPYTLAIITALFASVVFASVEVGLQSKTRPTRGGFAFLVYVFIVAIGNVIATLFLTLTLLPIGEKNPISGLPIELRAFFAGVGGSFGFGGLLKQMNISVYGKGVLAFEEWLSKARDWAVASAIREEVRASKELVMSLAITLEKHPNLNVLVANVAGAGSVDQLEAAAKKDHADPRVYKAYAVAHADPGTCQAFVNGKNLKGTD